LLFADLLKYTPVIDCPKSHAEVEKTLHRLQETAEEMNKATTDEYAREKIEKSWKLQDLLNFSPIIRNSFSLGVLGRVELCGALHVAYQSSSKVSGSYMLCALFKSYLVLATPVWGTNGESFFSIVATISLHDAKLENADNEQGKSRQSLLITALIPQGSNARQHHSHGNSFSNTNNAFSR
jgi:hypothetical protein